MFKIIFLISVFLFSMAGTNFSRLSWAQEKKEVSPAVSDSKKNHPPGNGKDPDVGGFLQEPETEPNVEEGRPSETGKLLFDLTDCVRMALRNNVEIRGTDYDIEESKARLKEAQPRVTPTIEYQVEEAPAPRDAQNAVESFFSGDVTPLTRVKIGIGFPLTSFGKISLAQSLAHGGIEASQEKKNQKSSEVVLKVKQLYYGLLLAREVKGMLGDAEKKLGDEVEKRESSTTPTDPVELAKLKLNRFEILKRLEEAKKKEELATQGLRIQMGVDRGYPFEVTDHHLRRVEFELKDLAYYLEEAKRFRPESHLLDIALKAKEDEYRLEKRKMLPDLGIGGFFELGRTVDPVRGLQAQNDFNDPFNYTRAGVGVRLKGELNPRQALARIRQKQAQYYKMSITKDLAEEGLDLDMEDAYLTVKQTKADIENMEKAYRLARQLVFLTKSNYDVGVGNKNDYGDALQAYLLMKGRYYEAIFNYNVAVATLISKVGYQYQP